MVVRFMREEAILSHSSSLSLSLSLCVWEDRDAEMFGDNGGVF